MRFADKREVLATKADLSNLRADMLKTIYLVGIVQLIGIIGSVIAIVKFVK